MQAATPSKISFRAWLLLLSAFASLPMIFFSVLSVFFLLESERNTEKDQLTRTATALASALDSHLAARASMLVAMANGDAARSGDLPALYAHAVRLVTATPELFAISLIDGEGNILFNTMRPYGEALPQTNDPEAARRVIATGQPQVSSTFGGTISHQKVTSLGVVVRVHDQPRYCLRAIVPITELGAILAQQYLPQDWGVVLLDGDKPIVARHPLVLRKASPGETIASPASEFPNKKHNNGEELIEIALENVGSWGWRVAVSVPETAFVRPLRLLLLQFGLAGLVCLLASIFASFWLARRLSHDINALAEASSALATGHPRFDEGTIIREMGEVRACLLAARDREEQALTDPLTGVPARARFWELAGELERQSQSDMNLGLAVMFIDLDGFKQVNDRYGHDRGDVVLGVVAGIIRESVRDTDVVGRLGGDEFAVCLTARRGHLIPAASSIAERIVSKVREIGYGIGCSIGVSVCEICSPDLARALTLADQAMYEAKRLGKDRYVIHEDTTA